MDAGTQHRQHEGMVTAGTGHSGHSGHSSMGASDGGHAAHDRHEGHSVAMFRDRFWLSLGEGEFVDPQRRLAILPNHLHGLILDFAAHESNAYIAGRVVTLDHDKLENIACSVRDDLPVLDFWREADRVCDDLFGHNFDHLDPRFLTRDWIDPERGKKQSAN